MGICNVHRCGGFSSFTFHVPRVYEARMTRASAEALTFERFQRGTGAHFTFIYSIRILRLLIA